MQPFLVASLLAISTSLVATSVQEEQSATKEQATIFTPFTGKITGSRVRLRLQPTLEGAILKELNHDDLIIVTGESDDYYAVRPDPSCKGYIYRTYVLDGAIEGNNVNIRLAPDMKAPIIGQFNQGDHVDGKVCPENSKWLVIDLPESISFYVAKDYVAKMGDDSLYNKIKERAEAVSMKLDELQDKITKELQKTFQDIQLAQYANDLQAIISKNQDLQDLVDRAEDLLTTMQEEYVKLSFNKKPEAQNVEIIQPKASETTTKIAPEETKKTLHWSSFSLEEQESSIVQQAIATGGASSKEDFYKKELLHAQEISGKIVPYERSSKIRPGDFLLIDSQTKMPIAYLYSSKVDLSDLVNKDVTLKVSERPNHLFALSAYFVLEAKTI